MNCSVLLYFVFKQKTAYEMRISDWSSDVCSSDLGAGVDEGAAVLDRHGGRDDIATKAAARKPERAAVERDEIFVHHVIVQREEGLAVIDLGGSRGIEIGAGSELAAAEADHPRSEERRVWKAFGSTGTPRCSRD